MAICFFILHIFTKSISINYSGQQHIAKNVKIVTINNKFFIIYLQIRKKEPIVAIKQKILCRIFYGDSS